MTFQKSIWTEFEEQQGKQFPTRIRVMWNRFGRREDKRCGRCDHLITHRHNTKNYFKCNLTEITCGEKTDWRKFWVACGKYIPRSIKEKYVDAYAEMAAENRLYHED